MHVDFGLLGYDTVYFGEILKLEAVRFSGNLQPTRSQYVTTQKTTIDMFTAVRTSSFRLKCKFCCVKELHSDTRQVPGQR
jgi:hypothetical protein